MTTEQTAKATTDSKPQKGDELVYIDWEGKKLHQKPDAHKTAKPEEAKP